MAPLWTALVMGLAGSLHCVGMCGPLALSLPMQQREGDKGGWKAVLLYNAGRIGVYSLLGAIIGALGRVVWLAGLQAYLGLLLGVIMLLLAFGAFQVEYKISQWTPGRKWYAWVTRQLGRLIHRPGLRTYLWVGALNGLLPCGLVYLAIAGAVTAPTWWQSIAYMAFFGLGTAPLMAATAIGGQFIAPRWRNGLRRVTPLALLLMAGLLLYRSIFFVLPASLQWWQDVGNPPMCH
jgi:sulfite exporter TauE/SafE